MPDKPLRTTQSPTQPPTPTLSTSEEQQLRHYLQATLSDNTRKTYRSALLQFERAGGRLPCDRDSLVRYILVKAGELSTRSLDLHITAIRQWHQQQGLADPAADPMVQRTLEGVRRVHGRPPRKARALTLKQLGELLAAANAQEHPLRALRDRALLLIAFMGAFRRSELVAIRVEDIQFEADGMLIHLPRSKTDQDGQGLVRAIPAGSGSVCPAIALKEWLNATNIESGAVFRAMNRWGQLSEKPLNAASINELLKKLASSAGLENVPEFSSHSFRRGMSTAAARAGVSFELIRKQGGWRHDGTVRGYIEEGQQLQDNAAHTLLEEMQRLTNPRTTSTTNTNKPGRHRDD